MAGRHDIADGGIIVAKTTRNVHLNRMQFTTRSSMAPELADGGANYWIISCGGARDHF